MCRINPLLGNLSVNTLPRESERATIERPMLGNRSVNKPSQQQEAVLLRGESRDFIKGQRKPFEWSCCQEIGRVSGDDSQDD
jgi:hypothetical protein